MAVNRLETRHEHAGMPTQGGRLLKGNRGMGRKHPNGDPPPQVPCDRTTRCCVLIIQIYLNANDGHNAYRILTAPLSLPIVRTLYSSDADLFTKASQIATCSTGMIGFT